MIYKLAIFFLVDVRSTKISLLCGAQAYDPVIPSGLKSMRSHLCQVNEIKPVWV